MAHRIRSSSLKDRPLSSNRPVLPSAGLGCVSRDAWSPGMAFFAAQFRTPASCSSIRRWLPPLAGFRRGDRLSCCPIPSVLTLVGNACPGSHRSAPIG